jgi:hypothetical protein
MEDYSAFNRGVWVRVPPGQLKNVKMMRNGDVKNAWSSNGRTPGFEPGYAGSNPARATMEGSSSWAGHHPFKVDTQGSIPAPFTRKSSSRVERRSEKPQVKVRSLPLPHGAVVERYNPRLSTGRSRVRSPSAPQIGLEVVWKTTRLLTEGCGFESRRANDIRTMHASSATEEQLKGRAAV